MSPSPSIAPAVAETRARYAARRRYNTADAPTVLEAGRDLAAAKLEDYIARVVAAAPPLTTEQRSRIASLLGVAA